MEQLTDLRDVLNEMVAANPYLARRRLAYSRTAAAQLLQRAWRAYRDFKTRTWSPRRRADLGFVVSLLKSDGGLGPLTPITPPPPPPRAATPLEDAVFGGRLSCVCAGGGNGGDDAAWFASP